MSEEPGSKPGFFVGISKRGPREREKSRCFSDGKTTRRCNERGVFLVARAYGKTRRGDRNTRKAFEILTDAKVAKEMASASDLAEAQKRWLKCCGDNRLKAFLHFRDKYLAHLGEPEPGVAFPTYGDVFSLARET